MFGDLSVCRIVTVLAILITPGAALGLSDTDLLQLKTSGIGDETLALIIREKTIETGALSVQEVVSLKRSGLGDATLRMLIRKTVHSDRPRTIVYGDRFQQTRFPSVEEILILKNAGVGDEVIQALVDRQDPNRCAADQDRSWRMLDRLVLEVED